MNSLVIVDMQSFFEAAMDLQTQKNILHEIKKAKRRKDRIILLHYAGCGPMVRSITDAVAKYQHVVKISKETDDGSLDIKKYVSRSKKIRFCGVNTDCCVRETAEGVAQRFAAAAVSVIMAACNSNTYHDQATRVRLLNGSTERQSNMKLVYPK